MCGARFAARGFAVEVDRFERDGKELVNVVGRRAGKSRRQIVVVAARDATGVPDAAGSAADTAALLELARVFEGRPSRKTLVLASVDGSTLGEVGTRRLAESSASRTSWTACSCLGPRAAGRRTRPAVLAWSNDVTRAGIGLQRTVADSIRAGAGAAARRARAPRASSPGWRSRSGIGAQGVLLERGLRRRAHRR